MKEKTRQTSRKKSKSKNTKYI